MTVSAFISFRNGKFNVRTTFPKDSCAPALAALANSCLSCVVRWHTRQPWYLQQWWNREYTSWWLSASTFFSQGWLETNQQHPKHRAYIMMLPSRSCQLFQQDSAWTEQRCSMRPAHGRHLHQVMHSTVKMPFHCNTLESMKLMQQQYGHARHLAKCSCCMLDAHKHKAWPEAEGQI